MKEIQQARNNGHKPGFLFTKCYDLEMCFCKSCNVILTYKDKQFGPTIGGLYFTKCEALNDNISLVSDAVNS